jgi:hypothetical protein
LNLSLRFFAETLRSLRLKNTGMQRAQRKIHAENAKATIAESLVPFYAVGVIKLRTISVVNHFTNNRIRQNVGRWCMVLRLKVFFILTPTTAQTLC